jgi:hypothetical protein
MWRAPIRDQSHDRDIQCNPQLQENHDYSKHTLTPGNQTVEQQKSSRPRMSTPMSIEVESGEGLIWFDRPKPDIQLKARVAVRNCTMRQCFRLRPARQPQALPETTIARR